MQELDLRAIFRLLLARLPWVVVSAVAGALLLGGYAALFVPEQYTSTAQVYVSNVDPDYDANATTSGNLSSAEKLGKTIRVVAMTNNTLQAASARLEGKLTVAGLRGAVAFVQVEDTPVMQVSVTHTDPKLAQKACQVMAEVTVLAFERTGEVGQVTVIDNAVAAVKTSPNVTRNAVIGGLAGLVIVVAIIVLRLFLNTTIRDKNDLRMRLDLPVLGEIPSFDLAAKGGK